MNILKKIVIVIASIIISFIILETILRISGVLPCGFALC